MAEQIFFLIKLEGVVLPPKPTSEQTFPAIAASQELVLMKECDLITNISKIIFCETIILFSQAYL